MARSSGGGSRSGGSRSGGGSRSSSSRSSSNHNSHRRIRNTDGSYTEYYQGRIISDAPFPGARKFVYYRNGQPNYIYGNVDLRAIPDKKPRYFLGLFYIPFLAAFGTMATSAISIPVESMKTVSASPIEIQDEADYFSVQEEKELLANITEFSQTTGIATQMVTVEWEEWKARANNFQEYALTRYYVEFSDEKGWLITYSEEPEGYATYADFEWEGVQGDDTGDVLDVVIDDFNSNVQAGLIHETQSPASVFGAAFQRATNSFKNQKLSFHPESLLIVLFPLLFIIFHAWVMIFAGTKQKYKAKELEEVSIEPMTPHINTEKRENSFAFSGIKKVDRPALQVQTYDDIESPTSYSSPNTETSTFGRSVTPKTATTPPNKCPSCGEPFSPAYGSRCPYCRAQVTEPDEFGF